MGSNGATTTANKSCMPLVWRLQLPTQVCLHCVLVGLMAQLLFKHIQQSAHSEASRLNDHFWWISKDLYFLRITQCLQHFKSHFDSFGNKNVWLLLFSSFAPPQSQNEELQMWPWYLFSVFIILLPVTSPYGLSGRLKLLPLGKLIVFN